MMSINKRHKKVARRVYLIAGDYYTVKGKLINPINHYIVKDYEVESYMRPLNKMGQKIKTLCPKCKKQIETKNKWNTKLTWGFQCSHCGYRKVDNPLRDSNREGMTLKQLRINRRKREAPPNLFNSYTYSEGVK